MLCKQAREGALPFTSTVRFRVAAVIGVRFPDPEPCTGHQAVGAACKAAYSGSSPDRYSMPAFRDSSRQVVEHALEAIDPWHLRRRVRSLAGERDALIAERDSGLDELRVVVDEQIGRASCRERV